MNRFSLDYGQLDLKINQQKVYRFNDVKDRLEKVAFDVVRFKENDNIDGLWQIQSTNDGEIIVAMYEDTSEKQLESKSSWQAITDKTGSVVNVFYKGYPVVKVASAKLGLKSIEEAELLSEALIEGLDTNDKLRNSLLDELTVDERKELLNNYPELNG